MTRVLLAEDDSAIAEPLARALRREGYDVDVRGDGPTALEGAVEGVDLVVLDLGLPGMDGLEVCREPARPGAHRAGAGADRARGRGRHRGGPRRGRRRLRDEAVPAGRACWPGPARCCVAAATRPAPPRGCASTPRPGRRSSTTASLLTAKEFDLLRLLVREAGRVVPREEIMREVWDAEWYGPTKTLDMHVSWLRRRLGDDANSPRFIATVRGVGFRFERDN
nr:response regulator transcription factor [Angustibacter aerolatus]